MHKLKLSMLGLLMLSFGLLISGQPITAQAKTHAVTNFPNRYYGTWYAYTGKSQLRHQKIYMVAKLQFTKASKHRVSRAKFGFYYSKSPKLTNIRPMGKIDTQVYLTRKQTKQHVVYYRVVPKMLTGFWWKVTSTKVTVHGKKVAALKLWQSYSSHENQHYMIRNKQRTHSWKVTGFN